MDKAAIRQLLAQSHLDEAIRAMLALAQGSRYENEVQLLSARYHEYTRQQRLGIESSDDLGRTRNQITHALLELLEDLPEGAPVIGAGQPPVPLPPAGPVFSGTGDGRPVRTGTGDGGSPPVPGSVKTAFWFSVVVFAVLLGISLWQPDWARNNNVLFHTLLGLAAAGVAATLPGLLQLHWGPVVKASGALAAFALVFLINPASEDKPITLTVFVTGKNGQSIQSLRQQGYVVLDVQGKREKELIDDKGQANFKNLRVGDKVRQVNVEFSEPYQSVRPDSVYTLDAVGQIYLVVALQHLGRVYGTVLSGDQPLAGVLVSVDNTLQDTTNFTGSYSISIPESIQRSDPEVKFFKAGYRLEIKKAYPQTNQPLNIVMQKIPGKKR